MNKVKWGRVNNCIQSKDKRIWESEWVIATPLGDIVPAAIKHFWAKVKGKREYYHTPAVVMELDSPNLEETKNKEEKLVLEEMVIACDYYEKHGKWE